MLTLSEKLLLLALHDEKGSVGFSASMALPYGLTGALLIELYLANKITFVDKKVQVIDATTTNNELLNEALALIDNSTKLRSAEYWLSTISSKVKGIQQRLANQLVDKGILAEQEQTFLWVLKSTRYPTQDAKPEHDIRQQLKDIVLDGQNATEEDIALLSLVEVCELIAEVFNKDDRKFAQKRIKELAIDEEISKAISQTVEQITAALLIIIVTSTAATSVVT